MAKILEETTTLREAQRAVLRHHPQVAVIALEMPDGSGLALLDTLGPDAETKVILTAKSPGPEEYRLAMRAGALDLIAEPVLPPDLLDAIGRASGQARAERQGSIVTVFSTKGGLGKTTISVNLAAEIVRARRKVFLMDLDLEFGNLSAFFGQSPKTSIADLVRRTGPMSLSQIAEVASTDTSTGVPFLPSPPSADLAATVEGDAKKEPGRTYVAEILELLRIAYDFVVVDSAPRFSEATIAALEMSQRVLMVTSPDVPALQATARGLEILVGRLGFPKEKLLLILNRANSAIGLTPADITSFLDWPIAYRLPSDGDTAVRACNTGIPLVKARGRSPLARAIRDLAQDVLSGSAPRPSETSPVKRALFGRAE